MEKCRYKRGGVIIRIGGLRTARSRGRGIAYHIYLKAERSSWSYLADSVKGT